jgi:hypothetical protein
MASTGQNTTIEDNVSTATPPASTIESPQTLTEFQQLKGGDKGISQFKDFLLSQPKVEVSALSSDKGAKQVAEDTKFLDTTFPTPPTTTPKTTPTVTQTTGAKKDAAIKAAKTPEQLRLETELQTSNDQIEDLVNDFRSFDIDKDPDFQNQARNIRAQYAKISSKMEKINFQRQRAFETLGFRTGTTRFAGAIQSGIEGEELTQANERMNEITRQENETLSAARTAFKNNKFVEYNRMVSALKDLRTTKADALSDYNTALVNLDKKLADEAKASLDQQKFAFDVFKFKQQQLAKDKPLIVSAGSSIFDPSTGEFVGTAPKPLDVKAPELSTFNGKVHQWNPNTNSWKILGNEDDISETGNAATVIDWANQVANGTRKFSDVPKELKSDVNSAISKLPPKKEDVRAIQTKISELNSLLSHPGLNSSVGPNKLSRIALKDQFGQKADFIGKVQKLLSEKSLQSLIDAKARGATFGALSDTEMKILQSAASTIGTWVRTDKKGNVTGYNISEDRFAEEITRIKGDYEKAIQDASGSSSAVNTLQQSVDDFYIKNEDKRDAIDRLDTVVNPATNKPYTEEEKKQIYKAMGIPVSFSNPSDLKIASLGGSNIARIASAIGQFESGGNYQAMGPDTGGGNRALGKYQIMQSNLPSWSKQALGLEISQSDFLNSSDFQDRIAQFKMNEIFNKYGTVEDVASVWFSGKPLEGAGNAKDVLGTTVPQYVRNIKSIFNNLS